MAGDMAAGVPDGTADPRLRMPFDQYQRYRTAADVLTYLRPPPARVLEVGGAPGPIEAFLPGYEVVVSDVVKDRGGCYLVADGTRLPFSARSFDAVITLDTLEHLPPDRRRPLLEESRRVSSDLVILCAPFFHPDVELAEEALLAFVRKRFGTTFETLQEHRDNQLPVLEETAAILGSEGWAVETLPSGFLPRWLLGMLFYHELLAGGMEGLEELHAYYNAAVSPMDCRSPSYRQILLTGRERSREELAAALDRLRGKGDETAARVTLAAIASAVLAHRMPVMQHAALVQRIAALERERAELSDRREALEHEVRALRHEAGDLDARVAQLTDQNKRLSKRFGNRLFSALKSLSGTNLGQ